MTRMSFDEVVDFIMERLKPPAHERRATRDKVRKRVRGGLGDGKLPRIDLATTDVQRNDLIYWARSKWPEAFKGLPIRMDADAASHAGADGVVADGFRLPASILECHAELRSLWSQVEILKLINGRHALEIARLKPLAERYEHNRAKNRKAARKPRNPQ